MDAEAGADQLPRRQYYMNLLLLAYQSFGVVYGDLSTSPLYVYKSTFSGKLSQYQDEETVFGVLSLIFWTFTLIPLLKYVTIVLSADDNGEGGPFALYSLLCRHAKLSLLPNQQAADEELSSYYRNGFAPRNGSSPWLRRFLEKHKKMRTVLLLIVLCGASMVIGDGVLTPAISVLSSMSGLQVRATGLEHSSVVLLSCIVLVGLFALQHRGTQKVAFMFAPIVIIWLLSIGGIGLYNILHWNPNIYQALSPYYMVKFFRKTGKDGWIALGGILLSMTGSEAMFADLGHFTSASVRVAFITVIYPCLILQYMGHAAFLSKNTFHMPTSFYDTIPGIACMTVMLVTTFLMALIIIFVWQRNIIFALVFLVFFGSIEAVYLSSSLMKVPQGGWVPLVLAFIFMSVMYIWHYGLRRKYQFDLQNKVSMRSILSLGPSLGIVRVPGIGLIYTELVTGVPSIFSHFVTNLPAFHEVLVFLCVKSVPVPYVSPDERYLVGRIGPKEYRMYRCIVRYGYKDVQRDDDNFENMLVMSIAKFIMMEAEDASSSASYDIANEGRMAVITTTDASGSPLAMRDFNGLADSMTTRSSKSESLRSLQSSYEQESPSVSRRRRVRFEVPEEDDMGQQVKEELMALVEAKHAGVAYIMGHSYIKARRSSSFLKKFAIDVGYSFLRKNCRGPSVTLHIPHISLIEVGMIYYV
ncbi:probable potassium transporter 2 isoform X3 [Miscanthus floridulus]|uniref:probable potassium transporter 2 isoform X3 n=1 Tax=Miscanthus floridulus TaxID=154761 RepID=UPI0034577285